MTIWWLVVILTLPCFMKVLGMGNEDGLGNVETNMKLVNYAGFAVELVFVMKHTRELKPVRNLRNGTEEVIRSYDTHEFLLRYLVADTEEKRRAEVQLIKGPRDETVVITVNQATGKLEASKVQRDAAMKEIIRDAIVSCKNDDYELYLQCLADATVDKKQQNDAKFSENHEIRRKTGAALREYWCKDPDLDTSDTAYSYDVNIGGPTYTVDVLFKAGNANIWKVDNFATQEECNFFQNYGRDRLVSASTIDENGVNALNEARKAQQAAYDFWIQGAGADDPIFPLYQRSMSLTSYHANLNLTMEGQEPFQIIQYDPNDEYKQHCDGACDGSAFKAGGRVATAIVYCQTAERGGGTTFTNANVYVKPKPLSAVFFSYLGTDGFTDELLTEHSGCPVIEGDKWIVTQWMRLGVSAEKPFDSFDAKGVNSFTETELAALGRQQGAGG
jgi:hypothetical protein